MSVGQPEAYHKKPQANPGDRHRDVASRRLKGVEQRQTEPFLHLLIFAGRRVSAVCAACERPASAFRHHETTEATVTETNQGWVRTWSAAPQSPDSAVAALDSFADATLRQEVRISGGGRRVRVRFTNEYGTTPLTIGGARIGGDYVLTFGGRPHAVVPAARSTSATRASAATGSSTTASARPRWPASTATCWRRPG